MAPLVNALCVACNDAGYTVNFGIARGLGSAASAVGALSLGHIIAKLGNTWMFALFIGLEIVSMVAIAGFPKLPKTLPIQGSKANSSTIGEFFAKYRWFSLSLLGIGFLAMFHCMIENYMIAIMQRLGGDSSHVGIALFISAFTAAPVLFFFSKVRKVLRDSWIFKIAALSFLLKSILFYFAPSITAIYIFQLIQITSYAFLSPIQLYYARAKIRDADMVKGQAFITAAYALGCSAGNFAGGQILTFGVDALLLSGIAMALGGTAIVFFTVNKSDLK
jgi:PPP family 3-phenylpropionic acid transporter